jgi:hypothetical protein
MQSIAQAAKEEGGDKYLHTSIKYMHHHNRYAFAAGDQRLPVTGLMQQRRTISPQFHWERSVIRAGLQIFINL